MTLMFNFALGLSLVGALALLPISAHAGATAAGTGGQVAASAETSDSARRMVHLLEYVAVDYSGAVSNGRVTNETEYDEQRSFLDEIDAQLTSVGVVPNDSLRESLARVRRSVDSRAPARQVSERARSLGAELRFRFNVQEIPPRLPSLENGRRLYAQACATCHGATGHGDGPRATLLEPKPASFLNRTRMLELPLSAVFATITYGIDGTSMASFEDAYNTAERYDLAFFVGSLAFDQAEVSRGAALAASDWDALASHVTGLSVLIAEPAAQLGAGGADAAALVAYARTHPEALDAVSVSLGIVRDRLDSAWRAYEAGDHDKAAELAIAAYLDGFEPVEPRLDALDADLRNHVEADFVRYRELLRANEGRATVQEQRDRLLAHVDEAETTLAAAEFGPTAAFVASLTVLAREGFEAVLIVLALSGLLVRAGRRDGLRYVHAGWMSALGAGIATWVAARHVIEISGAHREVIEGASSLIAAAILFYVSYWLIAKVSSRRWQSFLQTRIHSALRGGSLWTLAAIAFVAVYREVFETILFFEAILTQAGPTGLRAVVAGVLAGGLLLAALAVGAFRFGLRMPVRRFFVLSSALLYALAVVLAGQGVAALQEAGKLPITRVPFVRIDWLGIHPTLESLGLQALLLVAALVAAARALTYRDRVAVAQPTKTAA